MSVKRYSPEDVIANLREVEVFLSQGMTVAQAAKQLGISEHISRKFAGLNVSI
jgi:DNA-binding CsgD family transcriptional regulator